jgi:arylsulfate sulfotransferase
MKISNVNPLYFIGLLAALSTPASATVQILSMAPSPAAPQVIGKVITWSATASDTHAGPLTFRYYVTAPGGNPLMVKDFLPGILRSGTWTAQPFTWMPTACTSIMSAGTDAFTCEPIEGTYSVEIVAKDAVTSETATKTVKFQVTPLATGSSPALKATSNSLVALFGVPPCSTGSSVRASFQPQSLATPATTTNWLPCHSTATANFEIAGVYPKTAYKIFAQTVTGSNIVNGPTLTYTTGALPSSISFPTFSVQSNTKPDTAQPVILHNLVQLGSGKIYPDVATDLSGRIIWYYSANDLANTDLLTRPLQNGTFLSIEDNIAWNPATPSGQFLRQVDLAGNVIRETNTGALQQELIAIGALDGRSCASIAKPAPIGSGCLGSFHHDAIQTLPPTVNSTLPGPFTAVIASVEKIFPAGTQGDTSGFPVDVIGDMFIVLDSNWNVVWYWDSFQHDGGCPVAPATGPCQLDINRAAVLGETCTASQSGCPPALLLGTGIAPLAKDWLHANTIYYWPTDTFGGASKDLIWSSRHQDWVMKVDYQDGSPSATGDILWRMGNQGDFQWVGPADPWPWFSHQHEVAIENNGSGVMTLFDNGNTRIAPPPLGVGGNPTCLPYDCNSRGMALTFTEQAPMQVNAVLNSDLGLFSTAMGSAQLLPNGSYFFLPAIVINNNLTISGFTMEISPVPPTDAANVVLNIQGPEHYRAWQLTSMYFPPIS